jgi:hypothetical protein
MGTENDTVRTENQQIEEAQRQAGVEDVTSRAETVIEREKPIEAETEKKEIVVGSPFDKKRGDIYAKAKANREAREGENEFAIVPPDREKQFFGENTRTRSDRIAEARQAGDPNVEQNQQDAPKTRTLKINGRDVTVTEDDLLAHASRALASDDILSKAKQSRDEAAKFLEEVKALRAATPAVETNSEAVRGREPAATPGDVDLDEIVDRIQVGDKEQAKEAMLKFGEQIENRVRERIGNLDDVIDQHMATVQENTRRTQEVSDALNTFNDVKVNDVPVMHTPLGRTAIAQESIVIMRDAMREAGLEDGFVESLKREHGMSELQAARYCYDEMERLGHVLPSRADVVTRAGESVMKQLGLRRATVANPNTPDLTARADRKQQITSQPRRAIQPSQLPATEKTRQEVRLQAVRNMQAARGKRR